MKDTDRRSGPTFKTVPCECCRYPIAIPAEASDAVCIACPQCGHRACS
mgnify:CR=1 FL=1|jgi:hypothetical protein